MTPTIPPNESICDVSVLIASRAPPAPDSCLGMDERAFAADNVQIVDSITLNDFQGTDLVAQLERIRETHRGESLRVGVIGVWTEAKVSFLLYDLKTRLGIDELATCTALTASASRAQHFNGLSQLEKILGVHCFESLAEFVDWLQPGAELDLPEDPVGFAPRITGSGHGRRVGTRGPGDRRPSFRDSTEVDLEPLSGGYSGALVWRAVGRDAAGHRQAPAVVKLGPNRAIAQERVAFERIEQVLGNSAPRVLGFVDLGPPRRPSVLLRGNGPEPGPDLAVDVRRRCADSSSRRGCPGRV